MNATLPQVLRPVLSQALQAIRASEAAMPTERPPHRNPVITLLAREFQLPPNEVREIYERELAALDPGARVKAFVPIFASRRVRELLLRRETIVVDAGPIPDQSPDRSRRVEHAH